MKCDGCRDYVFTTCLCSMEEPIWHCRFGFSPSERSCKELAEFNHNNMRKFYKEHPDELQLRLKFDL